MTCNNAHAPIPAPTIEVSGVEGFIIARDQGRPTHGLAPGHKVAAIKYPTRSHRPAGAPMSPLVPSSRRRFFNVILVDEVVQEQPEPE